MKSFTYRNYSSQLYRPQPVVSDDLENSIVTVACPWGAKSSAEKCVEVIQEVYISSLGDQETTSPFETFSCLSRPANNLRTAVLFANEKIYNEDNYDEYRSACELLTIAQTGNEVHFIQVGQPAIYLIRKGLPMLPISCNIDMSVNMSTHKKILSPLPAKLVGLEDSLSVFVSSFVPQARDKVILLSRTFAPNYFYNTSYDKINLDNLVKNIIKENSDAPFWLGLLEF